MDYLGKREMLTNRNVNKFERNKLFVLGSFISAHETWDEHFMLRLWFCSVCNISPVSPVVTCIWRGSWPSRWPSRETTAGYRSSPTGTPCRLAGTMTPCLLSPATPPEGRRSDPRRPRLLLPLLLSLQPRGDFLKVAPEPGSRSQTVVTTWPC